MKGFTASGAWICHTGKIRKVNEDACLFGGIFGGASTSAPMKAALSKSPWVVALADGIGGHKAGAYASREVLASLDEAQDFTTDAIGELLQDTNRKLHEVGHGRPEFEGTGTAVVGLVSGPGGLFGFNVGDARLYRQQDGRLTQISRDDSVEQLLIHEGLLEATDGVRSTYMHALTQSVGGSHEYHRLDPHFYPLAVKGSGRFILCTDGLTDMISEKVIESYIVPQLKPVAAVQSLFSAAMEAGGRDNITIAIVDVEKV
ncbi:MAG: PP2C family serine/threonine-protein phosphatase [Chthoniobacteraceae bacterium]